MNPLAHFDPDDPYPESDGEPMAENTEQYEWLVKIKENLEILFAQDPAVFVAGDLFWYPVPDRRIAGPVAPDVMVAIGRPKGRRGCYKQWEEGGIAPRYCSRSARRRTVSRRWPISWPIMTPTGSRNTTSTIRPPTRWRSGCARTGGCGGCRI